MKLFPQLEFKGGRGRLTYQVRPPVDLQLRFLGSILSMLVVTLLVHYAELRWGWRPVGGISLMVGLSWWLPGKSLVSGVVSTEGLQMRREFVPADALKAIAYREGKNGGLYAGEICIGPGLGRVDAERLQAEIEKVMGARRED